MDLTVLASVINCVVKFLMFSVYVASEARRMMLKRFHGSLLDTGCEQASRASSMLSLPFATPQNHTTTTIPRRTGNKSVGVVLLSRILAKLVSSTTLTLVSSPISPSSARTSDYNPPRNYGMPKIRTDPESMYGEWWYRDYDVWSLV
ncbi:hypothetical protein K504DRAFT_456186 [Pleomassaria siparia CBS 279.74]|uniref:Uncharacterized protein n=1 Tax=Pleomassaria siparia CBS 279.74 TaxID=1314801 RepID=A0A6G1K5H9_9PLEO|nr:hypothetical protein K504DRAFT_456186 [Pleomassaria siparia CBS 279.74]